MNSASTPGASSGRGTLVWVLAVIGILGIIAAIMYISGAANSIHVMVGSVHHGHHVIRFVVSLVVGAAFLVGAYIARSRMPAPRSGNPMSKSASNA